MRKGKIRLRIILFILLLFTISIISCGISICSSEINNNTVVPYISPENTIKYYYLKMEEEDVDAVNSCFIDGRYNVNTVGKHWKDYKIVSSKKLTQNDVNIYKSKLGINYNEVVDPIINDCEILVSRRIEKKTKVKEYKFWYLLREFNKKWLIINYSALVKYD